MNQATRFFLEFLYQYVSFYPCVLLCCLPFTDKHKQSVRKIAAEAHGGKMEFESEVGKGLSVSFTVPVYGGQGAGYGL